MRDRDLVQRIRFWIALGIAVLAAGAGAGWTVAGRVYALETRITVIEKSHDFMVRQLDWTTNTLWQGHPTSAPPERKQ